MASLEFDSELQELRKNWGWFLVVGIMLSVLGLIGLSYSLMFTIVSVLIFGILMLFAGVGQLVNAFSARRWGGFFLLLLSGAFFIVLGVFLVENPLRGAMELTLMIGAVLLVSGIFRVGVAIARRFPHWPIEVLGGFISLMLGAALWKQWPESALWFIGFCVAIDLLFQGLSWIFFGLQLRKIPVLSSEHGIQKTL